MKILLIWVCRFGPSHVSTVLRFGDVGVVQLIALVLDPGSNWVGQLASFPSLSISGQTLQHYVG